MTPPLPAIPIFVSLFDALPIQVAEGLTILEGDVSEGLVVQAFGQRITLPIRTSATNDDQREIIFEGTPARPVVDIPNVCSLAIPQLRFVVQSTTSSFALDSTAFDVSGDACLEVHLPAIFGGNAILLDATVHIVTKTDLEVKHVRLDFAHAAWSIPLPGDAALWIHAKHLDLSIAPDGSPRIEMQVVCSVEGLPPRIQRALGKTRFEAQARWTKGGMSLASTIVCEKLRIPLPSFAAFGGSAAWNLDELTLSAKYLRIDIGQTIECSLDIGLDVPSMLHEFMEPHIDIRLSARNDELHLELLSSPFRALDCTRVPNGNLRARMRVGEGKVSFDLPALRIDWVRRRIVAEGQVSHQNLRIPLGPVRALLEQAGMHALAKQLPDSIPFQSFGLTENAGTFSDLLTNTFANRFFEERTRRIFENTLNLVHHVPQRLQNDFLQVHVPKEIAFRFECSFDFDARVHLAPSNDPRRAADSPIRWVLPVPGPHGPEFYGITLYRWAFGELRAGQMFTVEVDAEIERFELLDASNSSQSHLVLRDVVALLGQSGGVPWIVPLSFRKIGWTYTGHDGMSCAFQGLLSLPKVDFGTLLHWLVRIRGVAPRAPTPLEGMDDGHCECHVGPTYVRLPRSLGSKEFGSMNEVISLQSPQQIEHLLRAWQTLDIDRILEVLPPELSWLSMLRSEFLARKE